MNHLHFTQSLEPLQGGGLGSAALALHREFLAQGVKSVLCSTHGGTPQHPGESVREFARSGPGVLYYAPEMKREAPGLVKEADVLHGHGLYVGTNYIFGGEARRQGKPLVYHVHGMFEPYILGRSRWKKRLVHRAFEDRNIRDVRLWRALTAKEAEQIRACGYQAPIVIAPNGLELRNYPRPAAVNGPIKTPLIPELVKHKRRLLFLARIHPKKGLDLLLPAWARLGALRRDWELVIAGPDEQGYLQPMRALARSLGIENEIQFTGTVGGEAKIALFYSADLFVLPSYSEGLPMTLLEAMACEIPVVATSACNCPEVHTEGAGWICEPTAESVGQALEAGLRAADAERRERGQRGRSLVQKNYSWDCIAQTILQACSAHC